MAGKINTPSGKISFVFDNKNQQLIILENQEIQVNDVIFNSDQFNRILSFPFPGTYHLRFSAFGDPVNDFTPAGPGFYLVKANNTNYNPTGDIEDEETDLLLAEITYDGISIVAETKEKSDASNVISLLEKKQKDFETKLKLSRLKVKEVDGFYVPPGETIKLFDKEQYFKFVSVQVFKKVPSSDINRASAGKIISLNVKGTGSGPVSFPVYLEDDGNKYVFLDQDRNNIPVYVEGGKIWLKLKNVFENQTRIIECLPSDSYNETVPESIFSFFSDCSSLEGLQPYGSMGIVIDNTTFEYPIFKKVNSHPNGAYFESQNLPKDNFIVEFEFLRESTGLTWFELENHFKQVISFGIDSVTKLLLVSINGKIRKFRFLQALATGFWFKLKVKFYDGKIQVSVLSEDGIEMITKSVGLGKFNNSMPFKIIRIMGDGTYYIRKIRIREDYPVVVKKEYVSPKFDTSLWYGILSISIDESALSDNRYVLYSDGVPFYWNGTSWVKSSLVFSQTNTNSEINSLTWTEWEKFPLGNELIVARVYGQFPFFCSIDKIGDYYIVSVPHIENDKAVYYKNTEPESVNLLCRIFYWEE